MGFFNTFLLFQRYGCCSTLRPRPPPPHHSLPQEDMHFILNTVRAKLVSRGLEKKEVEVLRPWRKKRDQKPAATPELLPRSARRHLAIGVNEVTKALERNEVREAQTHDGPPDVAQSSLPGCGMATRCIPQRNVCRPCSHGGVGGRRRWPEKVKLWRSQSLPTPLQPLKVNQCETDLKKNIWYFTFCVNLVF